VFFFLTGFLVLGGKNKSVPLVLINAKKNPNPWSRH